MHDVIHNLDIEQALKPQTVQAAAVNSGNIDMRGAEALAVVLLVGTIGETLDASNRIDVKIEHADDNGADAPGDYAACADVDILGYAGLADGVFLSIDHSTKADRRHVVGYRGGKRFVKVTATPVSLATGGPVAMLAMKAGLAQKPVDNIDA